MESKKWMAIVSIIVMGAATNMPRAQETHDGWSLKRDKAPAEQLTIELSGMMTMGGSSVDDARLLQLQQGSHDPNRNCFTVQLLGLAFSGSLSPFLISHASIVSRIDVNGESRFELEEVYVITDVPASVWQFKAGQYFTEFGYLNPIHAHDWTFVDKPVVLSRFFGGDALRNTGMRLAWHGQAPSRTEVLLGMQQAKGETAVSFLSSPGEVIGGHTLIDREVEDAGDMLYSIRGSIGRRFQDGPLLHGGASALWGPNASGTGTQTAIYGLDLSVVWPGGDERASAQKLSWITEYLQRRYEAGDVTDPSHEILRDWGIYSQVLWQVNSHWAAGLRMEYATGDPHNETDPLRDTRKRFACNLTWRHWKNTALRFQYNHDRAEHLPEHTANSIWLQLSYHLGGKDHHEH